MWRDSNGRSFETPPQAAQRAAAQVLRLYGAARVLHTTTMREAEESRTTYGGSEVARRLAGQLRAHGLAARAVEIEAEDLQHLRMPTAVVLRSGAAVTLLDVTARDVLMLADETTSVRVPRRQFASGLGGFAIDLAPTLGHTGGLLRRLWHVLPAHRGALLRILLFGMLITALALLGPQLTRVVVDRALPDDNTPLLHAAIVGTLLLGLHTSWLGLLRARAGLSFDQHLECGVQRGLFKTALAVPFAAAQSRSVGSFLETIGSAMSLTSLAVSSAVMPLVDAVLAMGYLVLLASELPRVAALAVAAALGTLPLNALYARRIAQLQSRQLRAASDQRSRLHELLSGALTVKALGAESAALAQWLPRLFAERALSRAQAHASIGLSTWTSLLQRGVTVGFFVWGGAACLDARISVGGFLALAMYVEGFLAAAWGASSKLVPMLAARPKLRQVNDLLCLPVERRRACIPPRHDVAADQPAVVVSNVWFRYAPEAPWILREHGLCVRAGEQFALRGRSGMGKTTLLRLLAGLLRPVHGTVRVLGQDPAQCAGLCAYLPQEPHLLSGSLLSNLRTLSSAPHDRILAAAETTGLASWARGLPMGLETIVPPGGSTLSGGQRQLLLLTAAIASECPVLLLDESLAHLDRITRAELRGRGLFEGRTVISVVHDD